MSQHSFSGVVPHSYIHLIWIHILESYPDCRIVSWLWNRMLDLESYPGADIWIRRLCLLTAQRNTIRIRARILGLGSLESGGLESEGLDKLLARTQRGALATYVHTCSGAHERWQPDFGMDHHRTLFNLSHNERIRALCFATQIV